MLGGPPARSSLEAAPSPVGAPAWGEGAHPVGKQLLISSQCVPDELSQQCCLLLCSRGSEKFGFKSEKIV